MKGRFFLSLLLGAALVLEGGCARPSLSLTPSLDPSSEQETDKPFQRALHSEPGSQALERARIDYLLERVSKSPYNFFRNESRYTGKEAGNHFRWKYFLNHGRIKTAEDFVDQAAARSKRSGRPYEIQFPDKHRYPLRGILLKELSSFDQALEKKRKLMAEASEEVR